MTVDTQRGNNRQDFFLVDEDRPTYIQTLRDKRQQLGVELLRRKGDEGDGALFRRAAVAHPDRPGYAACEKGQ